MTQFRTATMSTMTSTDIDITRTRSTVTTTGQYSSPEASRGGGEDKDLDALPRHLQAPVRRVRARIEPPHRTRAVARLTDMGRVVVACLTMILLAAPTPARAGVPSEQLKAQIDRVVRVLDAAELRQSARAVERRSAVRRIANETFDFSETARRALGPHWQARTPAEREEFTALFGDLLERSYTGKIELYNGEKIAYLGDTIDGDFATVRTRLVTKQTTEVPIDYRMIRRHDRWRVYDVSIEGVSLVANYRAQFNKIIQTSGYASLVQRLRDKQAEGMRADAAPATMTSGTR